MLTIKSLRKFQRIEIMLDIFFYYSIITLDIYKKGTLYIWKSKKKS